MKYNYYNHKSLGKTLFGVSLCLLFVWFAYSCYPPHKKKAPDTLPKPSTHKERVDATTVATTSSAVNASNASVINLTNFRKYIPLMLLSAGGWYMLFHFLRNSSWVQGFPERVLKVMQKAGKTTLDKARKASMRRKLANNIVSSLHATLIFLAACCYLLKKIDIKYWRRCLSLSMGYFLADAFITCQTFNWAEDVFMLVHHLVAMVSIYTAFMDQKGYKPYLKGIIPAELLAQGFLCEITMPFIYACWYLINIGKKGDFLFSILSKVGLCAYFILRVVNFSHIGVTLYQNRKYAIWPFFLSMPLTLLNYYWFIKLVKKAFGSKKNGNYILIATINGLYLTQ